MMETKKLQAHQQPFPVLLLTLMRISAKFQAKLKLQRRASSKGLSFDSFIRNSLNPRHSKIRSKSGSSGKSECGGSENFDGLHFSIPLPDPDNSVSTVFWNSLTAGILSNENVQNFQAVF